MRIFSTITSQNQKWYTAVFFELCSRCASLRIILNIPYTEQEIIHTSSQKPWMSLFFLLRLDYVCNLTSKTKSFKMWMLQRWLPVINCPRQLETNTSSAGQREGTTLSPSLFMQIYSTIYTICVNTPQVLLLQALSLNILHLPSAFISTILNAEKYSVALPSGSR